MERSQVAIIIPAFNEAMTIGKVVASILQYGVPIVIDDCSSDDTAKISESVGAIVINHKINRGYDAALNSGFLEADKQGCLYAITFDADGQHHSELLEKYLQAFEEGYDLVLGVRPGFARFAEKLFSYYAKIRFGILDPLCGMKGYNMKLYETLGHFDSYRSIGSELTFYAIKNKKSFIQIPVPISARVGKSRFGSIIKGNLKILRAMCLS
ncbi:MAG: glycosyltransferase family 2 protein [Gammaproteobacteria bacterium]|nr:glycosyltransferase family 2 protein [Gammaproteobacteria bacterium]